KYDLKTGLEDAYAWFREHVEKGEARLNVA
ncbi:hypothetical protein SAMN05518861_1251, partial [Mesorhizobium sp. YR577]